MLSTIEFHCPTTSLRPVGSKVTVASAVPPAGTVRVAGDTVTADPGACLFQMVTSWSANVSVTGSALGFVSVRVRFCGESSGWRIAA